MAQQFDCFCRAEQGQEGVGQTGMCRLCQQGCIDLCFRMEVLKRNRVYVVLVAVVEVAGEPVNGQGGLAALYAPNKTSVVGRQGKGVLNDFRVNTCLQEQLAGVVPQRAGFGIGQDEGKAWVGEFRQASPEGFRVVPQDHGNEAVAPQVEAGPKQFGICLPQQVQPVFAVGYIKVSIAAVADGVQQVACVVVVNVDLTGVAHFKNTGQFVNGGSHTVFAVDRSEEHTSELQSRPQLVCRLLLEKK